MALLKLVVLVDNNQPTTLRWAGPH